MNSAYGERFHNDLRAALQAGVPIEIGDDSSSTASVLLTDQQLASFRTDALSRRQAEDRASPLPSSSSFQLSSDTAGAYSGVPIRLRAAAEVFSRTDQMVPVLQGLSARALASRDVIRSLRWPFTYIVIVLVVALLGMQFFAMHLVPELESMRSDLALSGQTDGMSQESSTPWITRVSYGFCALLLLTLLAMLCGGVRRFAMLIGGANVVRARVVAVANDVGRQLIRNGVQTDEAIRLATELTGADPIASRQIQSLLATSDAQVKGDSASHLLLTNSRRQLAQMKAVIPAVLVLVIGGGIALLYATAVFGPIVQLLHDLTVTGV